MENPEDLISPEPTLAQIKKKLASDKELSTYTEDELRYAMTNVGRAIHKFGAGRPKKAPETKCLWSDKVECKLCNEMITRSSRTNHNKTVRHKIHESYNTKLSNLLRLNKKSIKEV
jgi:hypothetical protein